MPQLMRALTAAILISCGATGATARDARCTIYQGGEIHFDGACNFEPDGKDGSFGLTARRPGASLTSGIVSISVSMISPGIAEVRGLTRSGINSRWGEARRSQENRACWKGADFQVCAR